MTVNREECQRYSTKKASSQCLTKPANVKTINRVPFSDGEGNAAMLFCRHMFQAAVTDRALSKTGPLTQYDHSFTLRSFQWELHWYNWYETVSSMIFNTSQ